MKTLANGSKSEDEEQKTLANGSQNEDEEHETLANSSKSEHGEHDDSLRGFPKTAFHTRKATKIANTFFEKLVWDEETNCARL
jgi:hypothetical protein